MIMAAAETSTGSNSILKTAFIVGGAWFLFQSLSKKAAASTLNFLPGNVKGFAFDGITPYITVGVIVQNTSNQSFTIHSLAGNVYTTQDGTKYNIGNVSTFNQQQIFANSQQTIWVDMRLSILGVVSQIINMINNGIEVQVDFDGYANVESFQVPLKFSYKI